MGNYLFLLWNYGICFYKKKKKSKTYSYLYKFVEKREENTTDLIELDNKKYCIALKYRHQIRFLDMNSKKITSIMDLKNFFFQIQKTIYY